MRNCHSRGEGGVIGTAKAFGIHKAVLIYQIIVNALLESNLFSHVMFYAHFVYLLLLFF
jgi:hypothetical protein